MRSRFLQLLTLALVLVGNIAFAQSKEITGVVYDESNMELPGASVIVKGSTVGTTTDFDGAFTITAQEGDVLEVDFIGYTTKYITVGESSTYKVQLVPDSKELQEVIVIGYGTSTKEAFTGSAVQVEAAKLEAKSTSNISQALAGETAGVTVINNSGQPGTESTVRIRGYGSVNGNRDPLYVVDGVPFSGSINSINPADIQSTTILKDASATAIYGSRGANGVILLTTKKGKSGHSSIDVDFKYGVNVRQLPQYDRVTNQEEYLELGWESLKNNYIIENKLDFNNPADVTTASQWASDNIIGDKGIAPHYNMWNKVGADLIDPATGKFKSGVERTYTPEKWEDVLFDTSQRLEGNVRMSGGVDKTTYSTSFGVLDDKGYYMKSSYKRYTTRMDIGHQVKDWLKGSMNIGYAYSETSNVGQSEDSDSGFWFSDNIPTIYPVYLREPLASGQIGNSGKFVTDPIFGGKQFDYGDNSIGNKRAFGALTNAAGNATYNERITKRHELNGNAYLEASFLNDFKAFTRFGMQYIRSGRNSLGNPFYGGAASQGGSISKVNYDYIIINFLQGVTYTKDFGDNNINVSLFHESNDYTRYYSSTYKTNLVDPFGVENNNAVITNSAYSYDIKSSIESYFGKASYNFDNKYYADVTVRRDGSSRFKNNKWGTFYSGGIGWIASKESFMEDVDIIKFLKFKTSYGLTGDQAGADRYSGYDLYSISNLNDNPSFAFETKGNPDLTWETSKMFQIGTEATIGDFLDVQFDYYVKNTDDLYFDRRVGPSIGYAMIRVNDGDLRNSGFEFDLNGHIINNDDFTLDVAVNGEILKNQLTRMPIDPSTGKPKILDINGVYGQSEGHSLYDFYMREFSGVDPQDGTSMWKLLYDDKDGSGDFTKGEGIKSLTEYMSENPKAKILETTTKTYSDATQAYIGKSAIPDVRGAFRIEASYKGFELSTQFLYQFGGYAVDYSYKNLMDNGIPGANIWHTDIRNRWQKPGDVTNVPRLSAASDVNVSSTSTRFLTSTDMISFNNLRIGYNFPKRITDKLKIQKLSVFFTGDNLWMYSKRKGFNPMTSETGSSSTYSYAPLTTYSGGVRLSF